MSESDSNSDPTYKDGQDDTQEKAQKSEQSSKRNRKPYFNQQNQKKRLRKQTEKAHSNSNVLLKRYSQLVDEADMSNEDDRKFLKVLVERGWANTEKSEQREHLQRKVDTTCVNDLQNWLSKGLGPKPASFLNHGHEQQVEIIFKVIDASLPKAKEKVFELLSLLSTSLAHCSNFNFLDEFVKFLKVKNVIAAMATFVNNCTEVTW